MAMQTAEYRERLVAGGFDEELADAIMGVAVAVRDDAVEEAVARAMEQVAHSAGLLNVRIDRHDEKNESQFRVIESTIREIASQIRIEIVRLEAERRLAKWEAETDRVFSGILDEIAACRVQVKANCERLQSTIYRVAFGLAGLMIALTTGVVVAVLVARGTFG